MPADGKPLDGETTLPPAPRAASRFPSELPAHFGRYHVLKLLGQGGMGSVYLAHDGQLDRQVALKIPLLEGGSDAQILARFYREARAAAALRHAYICPIHDVGDVDGLPYLTMAFIDGKPLSDFARVRPLTPRESTALVRKLALGLQEAHKHGVIHRDLKPANIMIDRRGEPVIMDFGLARRTRSGDPLLTQQGTAMGTPAYMPPEQATGDVDAMGPASDIYSLGVILYESLAGRLPFAGDDMMAVLSQVLLDEPPPPSRFRPDLDAELEAICLKSMAKRAADRYSSMADLAVVLNDYLRGKPSPDALRSPSPPLANPANDPDAVRMSQLGGARTLIEFPGGAFTPRNLPSPNSLATRPRIPRWGLYALVFGGALVALTVAALPVALVLHWRSARSNPNDQTAGKDSQLSQTIDTANKNSESPSPVEKSIYHSISFKELEAAAAKDLNDGRLLARLGEAYYRGWGGKIDHSEAFHWLRLAANLNDPHGKAGLGFLHFYGLNIAANPEEGVKWFGYGAEMEDAWALHGLAIANASGRGVTKSDPAAASKFYQRALTAYRKAADQGDTEALGRIGQLYEEGLGGEPKYADAKSWYLKATNAGNKHFLIDIGALYYRHVIEGKDIEALNWFRQAQEVGDVRSWYWMGLLYADGSGVTQSDAEALRYYSKSAECRDPEGMYALGYAYESKDPAVAKKWYEQAAKAGNVDAMNNLGRLFRDQVGVGKDYAEAMRWYRMAADAGNSSGMFGVGWLYADGGYGVTKDNLLARQWYEKAANLGNAQSMINLGVLSENAKEYDKAKEWYEKAADAGDAGGMTRIGVLYENGQGATKDLKKAKECYEKGAKAGDARGMTYLGELYENGSGVTKDLQMAKQWYEKAAKAGDARGMTCLGLLYEYGSGVTKNLQIAKQWYEKAAKAGDARGMNNLGVLYENDKKYDAALHWYQEAANNGDFEGMAHLGEMYASTGSNQNPEKAVYWYRKAAEGGVVRAQRNLGYLYQNGDGSEPNDVEAVKWFRKAANQGDADAQYALGWHLEYGKGIGASQDEAIQWYKKAAAQGQKEAKESLTRLGAGG